MGFGLVVEHDVSLHHRIAVGNELRHHLGIVPDYVAAVSHIDVAAHLHREDALAVAITQIDVLHGFFTLQDVRGVAALEMGSAAVTIRGAAYHADEDVASPLLVARTMVHEVGHLFGLPHCWDYTCFMCLAASHAALMARVRFCQSCRQMLDTNKTPVRLRQVQVGSVNDKKE